MTADLLTPERLQAICNAHGLGPIEHLSQPSQGNINRCWIVNGAHVIRFDVLDWGGMNRYAGEKWAYDLLRFHDIPLPRVLALDASGRHVPFHYLIMTCMPGETVSRSLTRLSAARQQHIAFEAGAYLATMHRHTFHQFGLLYEIAAGVPKRDWVAYIADFYADYCGQVRALGLLPEAVLARIQTVQERLRPLFDAVRTGHFVHGDYHFSNLLQQDGRISGVVDFDWAMSGDPSWDFRIDDQLEDAAPGSREAFYAGYTSRGRLPDQHFERVAFYRIGLYLDYLATFAPDDPGEIDRTLPRLLRELDWLENRLSGIQ